MTVGNWLWNVGDESPRGKVIAQRIGKLGREYQCERQEKKDGGIISTHWWTEQEMNSKGAK